MRSFLPSSDSDADEIALPAAILLLCSLVELFLYRFLASVNAYSGVGALGLRARLADAGAAALVLTGVFAVILTIHTLARLIHHRSLPGLFWRGIMVFIAPVYLLVMIWSLWTPLANELIIGAITTELLTILLLTGVGLRLPLPRGTRLILMAMGLMMLGAAAAWTTLDLLEVDRMSRAGNYALSVFRGSEFLMLVAPPVLFGSLLFSGMADFKARLRTPHIPAIVTAVVVTLSTAALILLSQHNAGQDLQILAGTEFLIRMAYRTVGMTMSLPFGPLISLVSLFFLVLLLTTLLVPFRTWKTTAATQKMGFGIAFFYIAGLQPFTVYQLSLSLLGFTLFIIALAERFPWASPPEYESLKTLDSEEHDAVVAEEKNVGLTQPDNN